MPDAEFDHPRLAAIYDALDPDRSDLDEYADIVINEAHASIALDIGCGTGTFALKLVEAGVRVVGVDPAAASLEVAKAKPNANLVAWIHGTTNDLPSIEVDAATMTATVAQVFLDDDAWSRNLRASLDVLRPGGLLVFEARRPEVRAWDKWTKDVSHQIVDVPGVGKVEEWVQVTNEEGEFVTFVSPNIFHSDGERIDSVSTLRFRSRAAIEQSLVEAGFEVHDVRDLKYAPGRSWLYLARRPEAD